MQWEEKNANQEYTQERKRKLMVFTGDYITLYMEKPREPIFFKLLELIRLWQDFKYKSNKKQNMFKISIRKKP